MKYKIWDTKTDRIRLLNITIALSNGLIVTEYKAFLHIIAHFKDPTSQSSGQRYFTDY